MDMDGIEYTIESLRRTYPQLLSRKSAGEGRAESLVRDCLRLSPGDAARAQSVRQLHLLLGAKAANLLLVAGDVTMREWYER